MSCEGPPLLNLSGLGTAKVCIGSFGRANGISPTPAQGRIVISVIIPPPPPPLAEIPVLVSTFGRFITGCWREK